MLSLAKIITKEAFKTRDRKSKNYSFFAMESSNILERKKKKYVSEMIERKLGKRILA